MLQAMQITLNNLQFIFDSINFSESQKSQKPFKQT